jgi:hypothetical protein
MVHLDEDGIARFLKSDEERYFGASCAGLLDTALRRRAHERRPTWL